MKDSFIVRFDEGMPRGTAQQKGECIRYRFVGDKRVPYVQHFKKASVSAARTMLELKFRPHRPEHTIENPIRLFMVFYFDTKDRSKWGKIKSTRPDVDNFAKECIDALVSSGLFKDDALVHDLHVKKYYAEKASIYVEWEELNNE